MNLIVANSEWMPMSFFNFQEILAALREPDLFAFHSIGRGANKWPAECGDCEAPNFAFIEMRARLILKRVRKQFAYSNSAPGSVANAKRCLDGAF